MIAQAEAQQHYRERMLHLRRVVETASCDRDVAMFRAHQHGMSAEEIAHVVLTDVAEVERVVGALAKEEGIDEWEDGPDWLTWYPFR